MTPRTSPTSARTYQQCPRQFAYTSSAAVPSFQPRLHFGSALHACIAQSLEDAQRNGGKLPELEEIISSMQDKLKTLPIVRHPPSPEELDDMLFEGVGKLEVFLRELAPYLLKMQHLQVERWVRLHLSDATGTVLVTGRIDLVFYDPDEDTYMIFDVKTGKVDEQAAHHNPQLALYASAILHERGANAKVRTYNVYLEDHLRTVEYDHEQHRAIDLHSLIETARASTLAKEFPAVRGHHCLWCAYQEVCFATLEFN
jgi:CRISPR/Cas system-associated exonuclease Cas4 (RecB family)